MAAAAPAVAQKTLAQRVEEAGSIAALLDTKPVTVEINGQKWGVCQYSGTFISWDEGTYVGLPEKQGDKWVLYGTFANWNALKSFLAEALPQDKLAEAIQRIADYTGLAFDDVAKIDAHPAYTTLKRFFRQAQLTDRGLDEYMRGRTRVDGAVAIKSPTKAKRQAKPKYRFFASGKKEAILRTDAPGVANLASYLEDLLTQPGKCYSVACTNPGVLSISAQKCGGTGKAVVASLNSQLEGVLVDFDSVTSESDKLPTFVVQSSLVKKQTASQSPAGSPKKKKAAAAATTDAPSAPPTTPVKKRKSTSSDDEGSKKSKKKKVSPAASPAIVPTAADAKPVTTKPKKPKVKKNVPAVPTPMEITVGA